MLSRKDGIVGVDLALLPVDEVTSDGDFICNLWFYLDLNCLIDPFVSLPRYPVSGKVFWPIEPVPQRMLEQLPQNTPFMRFMGEPVVFASATEPDLKFVYVEDIRRAFEDSAVDISEANDFERAAIAYVLNLDDRKQVVLYWC
jgi:hypothetical protein